MISTHHNRQTFVDLLRQTQLQPLVGEDVDGVLALDGTEPAQDGHVSCTAPTYTAAGLGCWDLLGVASWTDDHNTSRHSLHQALCRHQTYRNKCSFASFEYIA